MPTIEPYDSTEFWAIIDASYSQDEYDALMWVCKNLIETYLAFDQ